MKALEKLKAYAEMLKNLGEITQAEYTQAIQQLESNSTQASTIPKLYTSKEICTILQCSKQTLNHYFTEGWLVKANSQARKIYVPEWSLQSFLAIPNETVRS